MDFGLSEEQTLLQDTVKRFAQAECPSTRVRQVMESDDGHDPALWQGLAELGVAGMTVPTEHGGAGLELLDLALIADVLGWAATPGPFLGNAMATTALCASDSDAQNQWLPGVATGETLLTVAFGEGIGEWDAGAVETKATGGKLSGVKSLVPYAGVSDALIVSAMDGDGPGLWAVERGASGMQISALTGNDQTRRVSRVHFDGTPATKIAAGRTAADRARDVGLVLLAADASGGAHRCLEMTTDYALTREQFGQIIGAFQGVKHQLANLACDLEPAVSLWWYAAHAFDHINDKSERHAALSKAHLTDLYDTTVRYAIELHGGIGFTWEYDLHLWFRRAMFDRAFLGESSYHRRRAADLAGW
ncbi:MAG: acyl-CoA/acyl-ACP dehydrogenase [Candidatus Binatia bacterium]|nr:acyl-CoA/acyl-ACP dehydrogenase [Candidatus Binatia bacterium]